MKIEIELLPTTAEEAEENGNDCDCVTLNYRVNGELQTETFKDEWVGYVTDWHAFLTEYERDKQGAQRTYYTHYLVCNNATNYPRTFHEPEGAYSNELKKAQYADAQAIRDAVDSGIRVYWACLSYIVVKGMRGQYLIKCLINDHCIGLTWQDNVTLNGRLEDFYS